MTTYTAPKIQLHSCPRCHGDLFLVDGDYSCLQCGSEFTPDRLFASLHKNPGAIVELMTRPEEEIRVAS